MVWAENHMMLAWDQN